MISDKYIHSKVEDKIYAYWEKNKLFKPQKNSKKFSIVIPPPNVTGSLHMGHALNNSIQDFLVRYYRMNNYETLWQPGTDHAGIATQALVERKLENENLNKNSLGREKFIEKVWEWKNEYGDIIINQLKKLGCSCDWSRNAFTMDENLSKSVIKVFVELHKKKVRQFIVTSSSRIQVNLLVENLFNGFNPFEFIISSEDVELKKPNPLPYLKAIQLSGINKNNSIVFEDSYPGLKSSLAANLPTIFVPSNIPIVLEENIKLDCILDSLGDENNVANVIKGPKLKKSYVDYSFLNDYLVYFSNAKN